MHQQNQDPSRALADYPVTQSLSLRYGDMDIQRHINNVSIARYFEESRRGLHRAVRADAHDAFSSLVLAHVDIDFLLEVEYPGDVTLASGIGRIGDSSFEQLGALFQEGTCKAVSRGISVRRNLDRTGSQALNDQERRALTAFRVMGYDPSCAPG